MKTNKLNKYLAFTKGGILNGFAYKFSAIGWLLGDAISLLILYFLWTAIFASSPTESINGMTYKEMLTYLIFARVTTTLVFSTQSFWILGEDIYEGNIAISIIRPLNYRYRLLFSSFGNFLSTSILMFIPLMALSIVLLYFILGITLPGIGFFLVFILSCILSFIISDSLNFLIGELSIFTNALFGLMLIKDIMISFFSGSLLPSSFFPSWLNEVLKFLPFQSLVEKPIMILMGRLDTQGVIEAIMIQLIWVVVLNLLCTFTFNRIKTHVVSVGG